VIAVNLLDWARKRGQIANQTRILALGDDYALGRTRLMARDIVGGSVGHSAELRLEPRRCGMAVCTMARLSCTGALSDPMLGVRAKGGDLILWSIIWMI